MDANRDLVLRSLYGRATVYGTAGDYQGSMADLERISLLCLEGPSVSRNGIFFKARFDYAHLLSLTAGDHARAKDVILELMARYKGRIGLDDLAYGSNMLGNILWLDAKNDEALDSHRKALSLYQRMRDPTGISRCLGAMGVIYQQQGRFEEALALFKQDLAITKRNRDVLGVGVALNHLGMAYYDRKDNLKALKYFKMNLEISERIGYKRGVALSCNNIGIIYRRLDDHGSARRFFERALADSRTIGYLMMTSTVCNSIGLICQDEYRFGTALKYFKDSLDAARKGGYKMGLVTAYGNIGMVYRNRLRFSEALANYGESLAIARGIHDQLGVGFAYLGIASVGHAARRPEGVLENLKRAERIFDRQNEKKMLSEVRSYLANHYCAIGRYERARESAKKALSLARRHKMQRELVIALRAMARSWMPLSRDKALAYHKEAGDLGHKMFNDKEFRQTFKKLKSLGL